MTFFSLLLLLLFVAAVNVAESDERSILVIRLRWTIGFLEFIELIFDQSSDSSFC